VRLAGNSNSRFTIRNLGENSLSDRDREERPFDSCWSLRMTILVGLSFAIRCRWGQRMLALSSEWRGVVSWKALLRARGERRAMKARASSRTLNCALHASAVLCASGGAI